MQAKNIVVSFHLQISQYLRSLSELYNYSIKIKVPEWCIIQSDSSLLFRKYGAAKVLRVEI